MKTLMASALGIALALGSTAALAQQAPPPPPSYEAPPAAPPAATGNGEWVESTEYGWIWVPYTSESVMVQNHPYTYFYTPS